MCSWTTVPAEWSFALSRLALRAAHVGVNYPKGRKPRGRRINAPWRSGVESAAPGKSRCEWSAGRPSARQALAQRAARRLSAASPLASAFEPRLGPILHSVLT